MVYEILDTDGVIINTIIAEPTFVDMHYKGLYRDVTPKLIPVVETAPVKTLEEKVNELIVKVDKLVAASAIK